MAKYSSQRPLLLAVQVLQPWYRVILAALAVAAVGVGCFEPGFHPAWLIFGALIGAAAVLDIAGRFQGRDSQLFAVNIGGPLLWTVSIWTIFRLVMPFAPQAAMIPAGFIAWLTAVYPLPIYAPSLAAIGLMEGGLILTGRQSLKHLLLNLACYGLATLALNLFSRGKVYRRQVRRALASAKEDAGSREYARDLGLFPSMATVMENLPALETLENPGDHSHETVEIIAASFDIQLELIRQALELTTAALLWPDPDGNELRLRSLASVRRDIRPGPYPVGTGIVAAIMQTRDELAMAGIKSDFFGLPYYRQKGGVGSLLAMKIPDDGLSLSVAGDRKISAILCVDRNSTAAWDERELKMLRLTARLFSGDVIMGRMLHTIDLEKNALLRLCAGLRELNSGLGLEAAMEATIRAIRALTSADFVAISLLEDDKHRILRAEGMHADTLVGKEYDREDGLVGQVLKIDRWLPAGAEYRGPAPIFTRDQKFSDFASLLILPLRKEGGGPIGALTVGSKAAKVFSKPRRDILELVATQAAIKIDLAQSHERINLMASTDGLTGLANHRTFQHGLDVMLERAERQKSKLCLILCDIDHFKMINDNYGHPYGDQVLKRVALILKKVIRKIDLGARYGGEEFAVVLENTDVSGGLQMAERIRQEVETMAMKCQGHEVKVTMSLGLAGFPRHGSEKPKLISCADQALYQAKNNGRNRAVIWSD